jgi:hypothetical protein
MKEKYKFFNVNQDLINFLRGNDKYIGAIIEIDN